MKVTRPAADLVTQEELAEQVSRLREAIAFLANCVGAHTLSREDADHLTRLLSDFDEVVR